MTDTRTALSPGLELMRKDVDFLVVYYNTPFLISMSDAWFEKYVAGISSQSIQHGKY